MTFKSAIWYPIAVVLTGINLVGAVLAVGQPEPEHLTIHVALAAAFGLWAWRLRPRPGGGDIQPRLEALEIEVSKLRQALSETQDRLDFAERLLAQRPEARRVGSERQGP